MKNVTLVPVRTPSGLTREALLGPDGQRIEAFDSFQDAIAKQASNTIKNYGDWLARFFDYFFDAVAIRTAGGHRTPTHDELKEILESWHDYLIFGAGAEYDLARAVDAVSPSPLVSPRTAETMHASLRKFLSLSEEQRRQHQMLVNAGMSNGTVDGAPLYLPTKAAPTPGQISSMRVNSMLSGVIAGGPRLLDEVVLPTPFKGLGTQLDDEKAFPFDLILPLIDEFKTARDRALYAFKAASGARISECTQLLWEDIDFRKGSVRLVDPNSRLNTPSYRNLSPKERKKLFWKGRLTKATLLIEPFATKFWEELAVYRKTEFRWTEQHDFVFQHLKSEHAGKPYFLSSRSARSESFSSAVRKLKEKTGDLRLEAVDDYGGHSLRHSYGFYLLNYFPRADGTHGLSLPLVKDIMGHASVATTGQYARKDRELLEVDVAYSNSRIFGHKKAQSVSEMRREVLVSRLAELTAEIEIEKTRQEAERLSP